MMAGILHTFAATVDPTTLNPKTCYYVSADSGDDGNEGLLAQPFAKKGPFKTLARAQQAVRATIASGLTGDVLVLVRGGEL